MTRLKLTCKRCTKKIKANDELRFQPATNLPLAVARGHLWHSKCYDEDLADGKTR